MIGYEVAGGTPMNARQLAGPGKRAAMFEQVLQDIGVATPSQQLALREAMESAFAAGLAIGQQDPDFDPDGGADHEPGIIEFEDLPHDAQDGFLLLTEIAGLGRPGESPGKAPSPIVLRAFHTADGRRSWWAELPRQATAARWTPWVILTLERFGLLTELPNNPGRSTLTHRAIGLMQRGRVSLDVPSTPAWERNARVRDVAVSDRRQPAFV
jgi:hypothetical protein